MAKTTLIFAFLLIALGVAGFVGTGSAHPTALIPAAVGLLLGVFGYLAISPNERRRKLFMHVNVTIGLLGFLGTIVYAGPQLLLHQAGETRLRGCQTDDGNAALLLHRPLRALIYHCAALREGLTHGWNAGRWNGHGHARRAHAAWAQARAPGRPICPSASPT